MAKAERIPTKGRDLAEFRDLHDKATIVSKRIRAGLASLGDGWEYEAEFIRRCKVSQTDFAKFREQFAAHYVVVPGANHAKRAWSGSKGMLAKMREAIA